MNASQFSAKEVAAAALAEAAQPTLPVSKQFFSVHQVSDVEPLAHLEFNDGLQRWSVYLRVTSEEDDERYYWVSCIGEKSGKPIAKWGYPSAHSSLGLYITSPTLTPEEISQQLGLTAQWSRQIGDRIGKGPGRQKVNRWRYDPTIADALPFESKLSCLLDELSPRAKQICTLAKTCKMWVQAYHYDYAGWPGGWHLDRKSLSQLTEMGLELDLDLSVSGPELGD